jgi:hypothetical protein
MASIIFMVFFKCLQIRDNEEEYEEELTPMDLMYEKVLKKGVTKTISTQINY